MYAGLADLMADMNCVYSAACSWNLAMQIQAAWWQMAWAG